MLQITLNILYRWFWLLILTTLIAGATIYFILDQEPTLYRGSALLLVGPSTSSPNPELNDLRTSGQLLETYAVLATTRPVLEGIIDELNLELTTEVLEDMIEINTTPETQILRVRVTSEDPEQALEITNAIANSILTFSPLDQNEEDESPFRTQIMDQIDRLEDRIDSSELLLNELQENLDNATTREERITILNDILQERGRLSTTEEFLVSLYDTLQRPATNRIEIVEPATEATTIDSNKIIQTVMGAVAGLVLGTVLATAFEYFSDTITTVDDLTLPKEVNLLGSLHKPRGKRNEVILDMTDRSPRNRKRIEGYRTLATRLQSFLWPQDVSPRFTPSKTLLITATPENVNISDVIANLAVVLTQLGMRVTVLDANYDTDGLTQIFKLNGKTGLSEAVLRESDLNHVPVSGFDDLTVIPSGKIPASSFSLLASEAFNKHLETLREESDLLLIAAPELSSSDTAILSTKVDANLVLTVSGRSQRSVLQAGIQNLQQKSNLIIFVDQTTGLRRYLGQKASM